MHNQRNACYLCTLASKASIGEIPNDKILGSIQ